MRMRKRRQSRADSGFLLSRRLPKQLTTNGPFKPKNAVFPRSGLASMFTLEPPTLPVQTRRPAFDVWFGHLSVRKLPVRYRPRSRLAAAGGSCRAEMRPIIGRSAGLEFFLKAVVRPDAARAVALVSRRTCWESIARCTRVWSIDLERAAVHTAALISFSFISFFSAAGAVLIAAVAHVHCRPPN